MAACVLGRIYLYEGKYEVAEHYLRRALRLNSNDTDHLIQIASCFVFLGYVREAEEIYNKVVSLNPLHTRAYNHIGSIIAFESGDFKKCIALGENARTPWVDFPAFLAAAYFHAGDFGKMQATWEIFLEDFRQKILRAETVDSTDALQWIINVNPYREKTNLIPFSEFISGSKVTFASRVYSKTAEENHPNFFLKETGRWQIAYDGKLVHLNEVKGFYDLARLLGTPEKQFHCLELVGGGLVGTGEPAFDEKAKRNYQKKISALLEETRRAEDDHDLQRAAELRHEYEEILDHLSVSLGIGRKARKLNDPIDKARSAVTWRIRNAIQKIHGAHPALGKHLSVSIKTGLFCSYSPEKALKWVVEARPVTDQQPRLTM